MTGQRYNLRQRRRNSRTLTPTATLLVGLAMPVAMVRPLKVQALMVPVLSKHKQRPAEYRVHIPASKVTSIARFELCA